MFQYVDVHLHGYVCLVTNILVLFMSIGHLLVSDVVIIRTNVFHVLFAYFFCTVLLKASSLVKRPHVHVRSGFFSAGNWS